MTDASFTEAAVRFEVAAKGAISEIVGPAHSLYFHRRGMSVNQRDMAMEDIRACMTELNRAFAALDRAHAGLTVGKTASRIRAAAEPVSKPAYDDLEAGLRALLSEEAQVS